MSWRASAYVKALVTCPNGERISRTEKLVALVLADSHQDKGEGFTFPAVQTIAGDALMDPRVCRRVLAALERKGVIHRSRPRLQGRGQLTFYRFPALDAATGAKGGQDVLLSEPLFLAKRRTEGGRKEDKTAPPLKGITETGTKTPSPRKPPTPTPAAKKRPPGAPERGGRVEDRRSNAPAWAEGAPIEHAVDQVMSALAIANRRKRRLLRDVIALEAEKGDPPATVALRMMAAWHAQAQHSPALRVKFGVSRFFGEGLWKDQRRWHWDEDLLRQQAGACVGSSR